MTDRLCHCGAVQTVIETDEWIDVHCEACGFKASAHRSKASPERQRMRRHELAGFPRRFAGQPFERDDSNREAIAEVERWIADYGTWRRSRAGDPAFDDRPPRAPALWGRQGRGKTHLLVRLGERLIDDLGCTVMFRTVKLLLRGLQDFDGAADRLWHDATNVDVLLLDDLGAQRATEWRDDQLAELIDERYTRLLPVAFTTNLPPAAWEEFPGGIRTCSRLSGMTHPLELNAGEDRRTRQTPADELTAVLTSTNRTERH